MKFFRKTENSNSLSRYNHHINQLKRRIKMIANKSNISTTSKIIKQYLHEETGTLLSIDELQTFPSGFKVRYFTMLSEGYNPEPIKFKLCSENVDLAEPLEIGSIIRVIFQVRGREWEGRCYNDLEAKSLELIEEESSFEISKTGRSFQDTESEDVPF